MTTDHNLNPTADIYRMLDEAGITLANFQKPHKSQAKIINESRINLAEKLKIYITNRDQEMKRLGREEVQV